MEARRAEMEIHRAKTCRSPQSAVRGPSMLGKIKSIFTGSPAGPSLAHSSWAGAICTPTVGTPIEHSGWLWKKGHVAPTWKRRWTTLRQGVLEYSEQPGAVRLLAAVRLAGATQAEVSEDARPLWQAVALVGLPVGLVVWQLLTGEVGRALAPGTHTSYVLAAESEEDAREWRAALSAHTAFATDTAAADAQKQLAQASSRIQQLLDF